MSAIDTLVRHLGANAQGVVAPEAKMPLITVGFNNLQSFEFTQRAARALASSSMVPEPYRLWIPNKRKRDEVVENPNAIANCIVALNMAERLKENPLTVMQSLHIIDGRPSWASQFVIGRINSSGVIDRLRYRFQDRGEKVVQYTYSEWGDGRKTFTTIDVPIRDLTCVAWGKDKEAPGEIIEGPEVSIEMAVREGWYSRPGSKWQTMPSVMLRYRAAAFFGRTNTPELMMGLRTEEEEGDIIDVHADDSWARAPDSHGQDEATGTSEAADALEEQAESEEQDQLKSDGEDQALRNLQSALKGKSSEFDHVAVDENSDPVIRDGKEITFATPFDFAHWFNERYTSMAPERRNALREANADAIAEAYADPASKVVLDAVLNPLIEEAKQQPARQAAVAEQAAADANDTDDMGRAQALVPRLKLINSKEEFDAVITPEVRAWAERMQNGRPDVTKVLRKPWVEAVARMNNERQPDETKS